MSDKEFKKWLFQFVLKLESATAVPWGEEFHPVVEVWQEYRMPNSEQTVAEWYYDQWERIAKAL